MRYQLVVDDDGDVWPDGDPALSAHLRTFRSGAELQRFLISSLGFIGITQLPRRMEFAFDYDMVSPKALGGAIYWLSEREFMPTRVIDTSNPGIVALHTTRGSLITQLSDHLSQRKTASSVSRMPIPLAQSAFATRWRAGLGICREVDRPAVRNRLLDDLFQGYFSILSRTSGGDCTIHHLGQAYASWEPEFYSNAVGRTFRDVFDKRAGNMLADGYREIAKGNIEPAAESVRALISFPTKSAQRFNYDRLILPVGDTHLLIANFAH